MHFDNPMVLFFTQINTNSLLWIEQKPKTFTT